jgi:hypothetical protein
VIRLSTADRTSDVNFVSDIERFISMQNYPLLR